MIMFKVNKSNAADTTRQPVLFTANLEHIQHTTKEFAK